MADPAGDVTDDFDWGSMGEPWWRDRQAMARATEEQLRFASAFSRNGNATKSAKLAGYTDSDPKQSGYTARHSRAVTTLLAFLHSETGKEGFVDAAEMRRRLSELFRSGTASDSLRAAEALQKMDEREERARRDADTATPAQTLAVIRTIEPDLAKLLGRYYATRYGMTELNPPEAAARESVDASEVV